MADLNSRAQVDSVKPLSSLPPASLHASWTVPGGNCTNASFSPSLQGHTNRNESNDECKGQESVANWQLIDAWDALAATVIEGVPQSALDEVVVANSCSVSSSSASSGQELQVSSTGGKWLKPGNTQRFSASLTAGTPASRINVDDLLVAANKANITPSSKLDSENISKMFSLMAATSTKGKSTTTSASSLLSNSAVTISSHFSPSNEATKEAVAAAMHSLSFFSPRNRPPCMASSSTSPLSSPLPSSLFNVRAGASLTLPQVLSEITLSALAAVEHLIHARIGTHFRPAHAIESYMVPRAELFKALSATLGSSIASSLVHSIYSTPSVDVQRQQQMLDSMMESMTSVTATTALHQLPPVRDEAALYKPPPVWKPGKPLLEESSTRAIPYTPYSSFSSSSSSSAGTSHGLEEGTWTMASRERTAPLLWDENVDSAIQGGTGRETGTEPGRVTEDGFMPGRTPTAPLQDVAYGAQFSSSNHNGGVTSFGNNGGATDASSLLPKASVKIVYPLTSFKPSASTSTSRLLGGSKALSSSSSPASVFTSTMLSGSTSSLLAGSDASSTPPPLHIENIAVWSASARRLQVALAMLSQAAENVPSVDEADAVAKAMLTRAGRDNLARALQHRAAKTATTRLLQGTLFNQAGVIVDASITDAIMGRSISTLPSSSFLSPSTITSTPSSSTPIAALFSSHALPFSAPMTRLASSAFTLTPEGKVLAQISDITPHTTADTMPWNSSASTLLPSDAKGHLAEGLELSNTRWAPMSPSSSVLSIAFDLCGHRFRGGIVIPPRVNNNNSNRNNTSNSSGNLLQSSPLLHANFDADEGPWLLYAESPTSGLILAGALLDMSVNPASRQQLRTPRVTSRPHHHHQHHYHHHHHHHNHLTQLLSSASSSSSLEDNGRPISARPFQVPTMPRRSSGGANLALLIANGAGPEALRMAGANIIDGGSGGGGGGGRGAGGARASLVKSIARATQTTQSSQPLNRRESLQRGADAAGNRRNASTSSVFSSSSSSTAYVSNASYSRQFNDGAHGGAHEGAYAPRRQGSISGPTITSNSSSSSSHSVTSFQSAKSPAGGANNRNQSGSRVTGAGTTGTVADDNAFAPTAQTTKPNSLGPTISSTRDASRGGNGYDYSKDGEHLEHASPLPLSQALPSSRTIATQSSARLSSMTTSATSFSASSLDKIGDLSARSAGGKASLGSRNAVVTMLVERYDDLRAAYRLLRGAFLRAQRNVDAVVGANTLPVSALGQALLALSYEGQPPEQLRIRSIFGTSTDTELTVSWKMFAVRVALNYLAKVAAPSPYLRGASRFLQGRAGVEAVRASFDTLDVEHMEIVEASVVQQTLLRLAAAQRLSPKEIDMRLSPLAEAGVGDAGPLMLIEYLYWLLVYVAWDERDESILASLDNEDLEAINNPATASPSFFSTRTAAVPPPPAAAASTTTNASSSSSFGHYSVPAFAMPSWARAGTDASSSTKSAASTTQQGHPLQQTVRGGRNGGEFEI